MSHAESIICRVKEVNRDALAGLARFPLTIFCALFFTGTVMARLHDADFSDDLMGQLLLAAYDGFFWFLFMGLLRESRGWSRLAEFAAGLAGFGLICLHVFSDTDFQPGDVMLSGALVLLAFAAPFAGRRGEHNDNFWNFVSASMMYLAFAFIGALMICIGLNLIVASFGYLFGLEIPKDLYADIWTLGFGVFCPVYALAGVPKKFDEGLRPAMPPGSDFIINFILAPLVLIYTAILYAYMAKIALYWELPKGQIGWMVCAYGAAGTIIYMLAWPLRQTGTILTQIFMRVYFPLLLAPVALMALGISTRIGEYGMTEPRYIVVLAVIWLGGLGLYGLLRRAQAQLHRIPLAAAILLALASFGPWGAPQLSLSSQMVRLEATLTQHGTLKDRRASGGRHDVPFEVQRDISSMVSYLQSRKNLDLLRPWFDEGSKPFHGANGKELDPSAHDILTALGLNYVSEWQNEEHLAFHDQSVLTDNTPLDISRFTTIARINTNLGSQMPGTLENAKGETLYYLQQDLKKGILRVSRDGEDWLELDLKSHFAPLWGYQNYSSCHACESKAEQHALNASGAGLHVRLYPENGYAQRKGKEIEITSLTFLLLLD